MIKWKKLKTVGHLPRSGRPSEFATITERAAQASQTSLMRLNVKRQDYRIRKQMHMYGMFGLISR